MFYRTIMTTVTNHIMVLLICLLMPIQVLAWGADTHYGVTKVAVEDDVGMGEGATNLYFFLKSFGLESTLQGAQPCGNFLADASKIDGFTVSIDECTATNLVAAGAVLEDDNSAFNGISCGDQQRCRSLNHFFSPKDQENLGNGFDGFWGYAVVTGKPARDWAFKDGGDFTWQKATDDYFKKAIVGEKPEDRMEGKQKLFVTLGHVVHLVEEMMAIQTILMSWRGMEQNT